MVNVSHFPRVNCSFSAFSSNEFPIKQRTFPAKIGPSISHFSLQFAGVQYNFRRNEKFLKSVIKCRAAEVGDGSEFVKERSVSVILLAGGKGKRMGANMPKQYLPLLGQPIALYSLYTFSHLIEVKEIIVVCDPSYQDIFEDAKEKIDIQIKFTLPGKERQDSVYSGLQAIDLNSELVCIHDSARPLVLAGDIQQVLKDAKLNGAAVLGVPVKATIKEANDDRFVQRTLDRKTLWEMQTPQVIEPELLKKGFEFVNSCAIGESMCLNSLRISRLSSVVAGGCDPIGLACLKLIGGRLGDTVAMLEGLGLMVGDRCKLHLGYQLKLKLGWIHWMVLEAGDLLLLFSYFFLRSRGRLS